MGEEVVDGFVVDGDSLVCGLLICEGLVGEFSARVVLIRQCRLLNKFTQNDGIVGVRATR